MLNRIDEHWTQGTHINFRNLGHMNGSTGYQRKTNIYEVLEKGGGLTARLGEIRWFGRWRKYVFSPCEGTVYEEVCMGEISEFIVQETQAHKQKAKANAAEKTDMGVSHAAHPS